MSDSEAEIDDIINRFQLAGLIRGPQNVNNNQNMNNQAGNAAGNAAGVNYQLLRLYIDTIPQYNGDPHTLTIFINNCTSLINNFYREGDEAHNNFIVRAIIGKLSGRALSLIGSRIHELNTWNDIKTALELSFGDQRNLDCLVQDLITITIEKNETPYNFGMRCQDARSLIFSKLNSLNLPAADRLIRVQNYEELALKTFIRNLTGQLQNNVRLRNPRNLEEGMSLVIEEENFLYSQNRNNTINTQKFNPNQRITPINPKMNVQKPINYQNNHSSNFTQFNPPKPIFNNNFSRPPFPNFQPRPFGGQPPFQFRPNYFPTQKHPYFMQRNQPINNQYRPNTNQFNNQNRFNNSSFNNQYRPNTNQPNNQNRFGANNLPNQRTRQDEPMDTSSGLTKTQGSAPKYTFTELYQQNIENDIPPNQYLDPNYYYSEDQNYLDYTHYNPDLYNHEQYYSDINYDTASYDQFYEPENPAMMLHNNIDNSVLGNAHASVDGNKTENFTISTFQNETT